MIRHIVIFQLQEEKATSEKLQEIKLALEALVNKIDVLQKIEVGINSNKAEKEHLVLSADVEDMAALDTYATHPEHVKVGGLIRPVLVSRTCVDYKI